MPRGVGRANRVPGPLERRSHTCPHVLTQTLNVHVTYRWPTEAGVALRITNGDILWHT